MSTGSTGPGLWIVIVGDIMLLTIVPTTSALKIVASGPARGFGLANSEHVLEEG
jgi:hypothetical protein